MSWETLYSLTNGWALLGWAAHAFLPRGPRILSLILYVGVALLCLTYAILLGGLVFGGRDAEGPKAALDFNSLAGVMELFAIQGAMQGGWVPHLAYALFAGR